MPTEIPAYDRDAVRQQLEKYLSFGFSPIPLKGKVANYRWKDFTLTKSNMNQYIKAGTNWGLRSGRLPSGVWLWFIDLDSRELLSNELESNFALLNAPIVSTGKGFHIYCSWVHEVKTTHLSKIDIIANGYVVAPPSIHQSGKPYRFIRSLDSIPPLVNPEDLAFTAQSPPIIKNPVSPVLHRASSDASTDNSSNTAAPKCFDPLYCASQFSAVQQGQRHSTLVSIIGIEIARSFTEEETLSIVLVWNKRNQPPMSKAEVINTVRDCYQRYDKYVPIEKSPLSKSECE